MRKMYCATALLGICGLATAATAGTIFVDDDAAPGGDGSSWATAFAHLSDALAAAGVGDEIRVAGGLYNPDTSAANPAGSGSRAATFTLKNGVSVTGGWGGAGDPLARDLVAYETVLSGDLNGDDDTGGSNAENSYHVLFFVSPGSSAMVDGVTVTAGNANSTFSNSQGGGLIHALCDLTLFDVTFRGNFGKNGGGAYVQDGLVDFVGCNFFDNTATEGGGLFRNGADSLPAVFIDRCVFDGNSAGIGGGASFFNNRPGVEINRSVFTNNHANTFGGAINGLSGGHLLANSLVAGNNAGNCGGGIGATSAGSAVSATIVNTTIADNTAGSKGGGVCQTSSLAQPEIDNSVVWGNSDGAGSGETSQLARYSASAPYALVSYSIVEGYTPGGVYAGAGNSGDDPLFVSPPDGDYHVSLGSPAIDAGSDGLYPAGIPAYDLDGEARFGGLSIDMGAYEFANPDSDSDGLLDVDEITIGTDPFNPDTDGDGVNDALDPTPTVPGVPQETLEIITRDTSEDIATTDLGSFDAPNNNAAKGRRNSLASRVQEAANAINEGDYDTAVSLLDAVMKKIDGDPQPPDWIEGAAAADLRAQVQLLLDLIAQL